MLATAYAPVPHERGHSDDVQQELVQLFTEFLDSQRGADGIEYREKIRTILRRNETRLVANINDIRGFHPDLCRGILEKPLEYLPALDAALKRIAETLQEGTWITYPFRVGLEGSFGSAETGVRGLSASRLSQLVCLDGIVTSCFAVRPRLAVSVHYSETRRMFISRDYGDAMNATSMGFPTQDSDGNPLTLEHGLSQYRDHQRIVVQELPENAPPGQLPRSLEVLLADDLADRAKPGDRVRLVGILKALPIQIADNDIREIRTLAGRDDVLTVLARAFAPSIHGHMLVKKALLLLLFGGVERIVGGTHLRGDMNILLVGDPSTAKSQLLRLVAGAAPLAVSTTGRGATGVGLTAAVAVDRETGEKRLEAGAMVLADRGVVCIDEFDKMSDSDRVSIHEVMEQQTVTVAKAGLHLSLNARCAVVAAANPAYSQWMSTLSVQENLRMPDSLLSRFDLVFVMRDRPARATDRRLAGHVVRLHTGEFRPTDDDESMISAAFVQRYVAYAKARVKPVLGSAAVAAIRAIYISLRNRGGIEVAPTPRTLETLVRLSTAHARARLSTTVEEQDALVAEELIRSSLLQDDFPTSKRHRAEEQNEDSEGDETDAAREGVEVMEEFVDPDTFETNLFDALDLDVVTEEPVEVGPIVRAVLSRLRSGDAFIPVDSLLAQLEADETPLARTDVDAVLTAMEAANQIMYRDSIIIFL